MEYMRKVLQFLNRKKFNLKSRFHNMKTAFLDYDCEIKGLAAQVNERNIVKKASCVKEAFISLYTVYPLDEDFLLLQCSCEILFLEPYRPQDLH